MLTPIVLSAGALAASSVVAGRIVKPWGTGKPAGILGSRAAAASCSSSLPASCQNTTVETNTCCFEGLVRTALIAPDQLADGDVQGLIQQVQFWDTDPVTGPSDSWTIHGLWPN